MRTQIKSFLFACTILLLAACSSAPAPTPPPLVAEEPTTQEQTTDTAIDVEKGVTEDTAVEETATQNNQTDQAETADVIETAETIETETLDAADASFAANGLIVDVTDPIIEADYILSVALPTEPTNAVQFSHPSLTMDSQIAFQQLSKIGFPGPLYQEFISPQVRFEGNNNWERPFYAFRGTEILTIMAGNVFYENRAVTSQYPSTITFEETRSLTEAQIAIWGGFDFDYVLVDDGGATVAVKRLINGRPLEYGEAYFNYNNDGQLVFASLNTLDQMSTGISVNIISAGEAWNIINQRQFDFANVNYYFEHSNQPLPTEPDFIEPDYLAWYRTYQPGETVDIYGYPFLYLPVEDDGEPYLQLGDYIVQGPAAELRAMGSGDSYQIKATGTLAADGKTLILDQWSDANDLYSEFYEGTVTRDGTNGILTTFDQETFFIPNLPEDFPDTLDTYINAWVIEQENAPYPVLEWVNLDEIIPFEETGDEGDATILPVEPSIVFEAIESITIDSIELGHSYIVQWNEFTEEQGFEIPSGKVAPTWFFAGTADTGERVVFTVNAALD